MINRVMLGTLSTFTTVLTPFGGSSTAAFPIFRLENHQASTQEAACNRALGGNALGLKIDTRGDRFVVAEVQGRYCSSDGSIEPAQFSLVLPADLLDSAFLQKLPENASFVVSGLPQPQDQSSEPEKLRTRVKVTRGASSGKLSPLNLEWLPDDSGRIPHPPMVIWIGKDHLKEFPWQKVLFAEMKSQAAFDVTGQFAASNEATSASQTGRKKSQLR